MAPSCACCARAAAPRGTPHRLLGTIPEQQRTFHMIYLPSCASNKLCYCCGGPGILIVISDHRLSFHVFLHVHALVWTDDPSFFVEHHCRWCSVFCRALIERLWPVGEQMLTRRGLETLRAPVPSLVYMSSALPAFGKHTTRHLDNLSNVAATRLALCSSGGLPYKGTRKNSGLQRATWALGRMCD